MLDPELNDNPENCDNLLHHDEDEGSEELRYFTTICYVAINYLPTQQKSDNTTYSLTCQI